MCELPQSLYIVFLRKNGFVFYYCRLARLGIYRLSVDNSLDVVNT